MDFFFEDKVLQQTAINNLKEIIEANTKFHLICLPQSYLLKIKEICGANTQQFIDDYILLERIIQNENAVDFKAYEKVISYFLARKMPRYHSLISLNACIPTCDRHFKHVHDLIDPNADPLYSNMFEKSDDLFPSDQLCGDKAIIANLICMRLITTDLTTPILINRMEKVSKLATANQIDKAKSLSAIVLQYLGLFFKRNPTQAELKAKLNSIAWLFAKPKPASWSLPWYGGENAIYQASDLFSDAYECELGCVKPFFESRYDGFITGHSLTFDDIVQQIRFLINFFENANSQNDAKIRLG